MIERRCGVSGVDAEALGGAGGWKPIPLTREWRAIEERACGAARDAFRYAGCIPHGCGAAASASRLLRRPGLVSNAAGPAFARSASSVSNLQPAESVSVMQLDRAFPNPSVSSSNTVVLRRSSTRNGRANRSIMRGPRPVGTACASRWSGNASGTRSRTAGGAAMRASSSIRLAERFLGLARQRQRGRCASPVSTIERLVLPGAGGGQHDPVGAAQAATARRFIHRSIHPTIAHSSPRYQRTHPRGGCFVAGVTGACACGGGGMNWGRPGGRYLSGVREHPFSSVVRIMIGFRH